MIARERPDLPADRRRRPAPSGAGRRVAAELGVIDAVEFVGWTHDLPGVLEHRMDVAVAPSTTWTEALPLAILEALGCGCR